MGEVVSVCGECCTSCSAEEIGLGVGVGAGVAMVGGGVAYLAAFGGHRPSFRLNNKRLKQYTPSPIPLPPTLPVDVDGSRYGLLIGINYFGTPYELDGCVNDVHRLAQRLSYCGYYLICLTDDQQDSRYVPTKVNIINGLWHLIDRVQEGQGRRLFLHFSGHGSQVKDTSGEEADGLDETICPIDFRIPQDGEKHGMITDDLLREIFVKRIPAGNRLTAVFDCCHSGTVLDLPFYVIGDGTVRKNMVGDQFSQMNEIPCDAVLFSGCHDAQKSADIKDVGEAFLEMRAESTQGAGGALTTALLRALATHTHTLGSMLSEVRMQLRRLGFQQIPQLSSSRPYDLRSPFDL